MSPNSFASSCKRRNERRTGIANGMISRGCREGKRGWPDESTSRLRNEVRHWQDLDSSLSENSGGNEVHKKRQRFRRTGHRAGRCFGPAPTSETKSRRLVGREGLSDQIYAATVPCGRDCGGESLPNPTEAVWRISSTRKNARKTITALRRARLRQSKRKTMVLSSSKSTIAPIAEHASQCATSQLFNPRNNLQEKQPARNQHALFTR